MAARSSGSFSSRRTLVSSGASRGASYGSTSHRRRPRRGRTLMTCVASTRTQTRAPTWPGARSTYAATQTCRPTLFNRITCTASIRTIHSTSRKSNSASRRRGQRGRGAAAAGRTSDTPTPSTVARAGAASGASGTTTRIGRGFAECTCSRSHGCTRARPMRRSLPSRLELSRGSTLPTSYGRATATASTLISFQIQSPCRLRSEACTATATPLAVRSIPRRTTPSARLPTSQRSQRLSHAPTTGFIWQVPNGGVRPRRKPLHSVRQRSNVVQWCTCREMENLLRHPALGHAKLAKPDA